MAEFRRPQGQRGLRPTASPVDTYVRPQERQVAPPDPNNTLAGLYEGLSAVEPELKRHLEQRRMESYEEEQEEARRRVENFTTEEARKLYEKGELAERDHPVYLESLNGYYGAKMAQHRAMDLERRMNGETTRGGPGFDPISGNIEEFLQQARKRDLQTLQGDASVTAYDSIFSKASDAFRDQHNKMEAERFDQERGQASFDILYDTGVNGIEEGADPQTIHDTMRSSYAQLREQFGMSNRQIDDAMMDVAAEFARKGHYGVVERILKDERGGVGPLGEKRANVAQAARILDTARKVRSDRNKKDAFDARVAFKMDAARGRLDEQALEAYREQYPGSITQAEAERMVVKSRGAQQANVTDFQLARLKEDVSTANDTVQRGVEERLLEMGQEFKFGLSTELKYRQFDIADGQVVENEEVLDGQALEERFVEVNMADLANQAERKVEEFRELGLPEQEAQARATEWHFSQQAQFFQKNGVVNPQWKKLLGSGHMSITNMDLAKVQSAEDLPPAFRQSINLYQRLDAAGALGDHLKGNTVARNFYEKISIAQQVGGMDDLQAAVAAKQWYENTDGELNYHQRPQYREVEDAVSDMMSDSGNENLPSNKLTELAQLYVGMGAPTDVALEKARKRITENSVLINDHLVAVKDRSMPTKFSEYAERHIAEWAEAAGVDPSEYTAVPVGNQRNVWRVMQKNHGMTLFPTLEDGSLPENTVFKISDLARFDDQDRQAQISETRQNSEMIGEAEQRIRDAQQTDTTSTPQNLTRESFEEEFQSSDEARQAEQMRRERAEHWKSRMEALSNSPASQNRAF